MRQLQEANRFSRYHLETGTAKCGACGSVINLKDEVNKKETVSRPQNISSRREAGKYIIERKWYSRRVIILILFTVGWIVVVASFYTETLYLSLDYHVLPGVVDPLGLPGK